MAKDNSTANIGFEQQIWAAADILRGNIDAAEYKHVVLGLIFLKYVSDAFDERQSELKTLFAHQDDKNIYYMARDQYDSDEEYQQAMADELEIIDYYQEKMFFGCLKQHVGRHYNIQPL